MNFNEDILEKSKGSEFEIVLRRAYQNDPEAVELLKNRGFQKRLFVYVNKKHSSPEGLMRSVFYKTVAAIAVVLVERVLLTLIERKGGKR